MVKYTSYPRIQTDLGSRGMVEGGRCNPPPFCELCGVFNCAHTRRVVWDNSGYWGKDKQVVEYRSIND